MLERKDEVLTKTAHGIFKEYFDKKRELKGLQDSLAIETCKNEIEELNNTIIGLLKTDFSADISQKMLIIWYKDNLRNFDTLNDAEKNNLSAIFINNKFLDRLILGKGSKKYHEKSGKYAKNGKKFIKNLLMTGPDEVSPKEKEEKEEEKESKIKKIKKIFSKSKPTFPHVKHHLGKERTAINHYLLSASRLNKTEKKHIKTIRNTAAEIFKARWEKVRHHLNDTVYKNPEIQKNIREIIYEDLKIKNAKKLQDESDYKELKKYFDDTTDGKDKDTSDSLKTLLRKYQTLDNFEREKEAENKLTEYKSIPDSFRHLLEKYPTFSRFKQEIDKEEKKKLQDGSDYKELKKYFDDTTDGKDKDISESLEILLKKYPTLADFEQEKEAEKKLQDESGYSELKKYLDDKTADFCIAEKDTTINLHGAATKQSSSQNNKNIRVALSNTNASNFLNTIMPIFSKHDVLPDFVTREDLANFFIFYPGQLMGLRFNENESLLMRMGDIDEFIALTNMRKAKMSKAGIEFPPTLFKNLDIITKLQSVKHEREEKLSAYLDTLDKTSTLLNEAEKHLKIGEEKNQHQSQLSNFTAVVENLNDLKLTRNEHTAFTMYLKKINSDGMKHKAVKITTIIDKLDALNEKLKSSRDELNNIKRHIEKKQQLRTATPDHELEIAHTNIQKKLNEIEKVRNRINSLKKAAGKNSKKHSSARNRKKLRTPNSHKNNSKHPEKAMVLYLIMMTRKSIFEGKPSRKYLDKLDNDPALKTFLLFSSLLLLARFAMRVVLLFLLFLIVAQFL